MFASTAAQQHMAHTARIRARETCAVYMRARRGEAGASLQRVQAGDLDKVGGEER
jgi:hypothetical protein